MKNTKSRKILYFNGLSIGFFCAFLGVFLFVFSRAFVQAPVVAINEIAWMGTKVEGIDSKNWWRYEWLELYNNSDNEIKLDGWKIELYKTNLDWSLELRGGIAGRGYFLITSSDKIFPGFDLNYSNLGGKLANTGQKIILKNEKGEIVDEVDCSQGWFAGDNSTKQTMERKSPRNDGNDANNWTSSKDPGGTPKKTNSNFSLEKTSVLPSPAELSLAPGFVQSLLQSPEAEQNLFSPAVLPSPFTDFLPEKSASFEKYAENIVINEILPKPLGPDETEEWIELFNKNVFEADISSWQISDEAGKTVKHVFPEGTKISSQGFLILSRKDSKITLNNDNDIVSLFWPNGQLLDKTSYKEAPLGESYNRFQDVAGETNWAWSSRLTLGEPNLLSEAATNLKQSNSQETGKTQNKNPDNEIPKKQKLASLESATQEGSQIFPLSTALAIAIFSGFAILSLKRKFYSD